MPDGANAASLPPGGGGGGGIGVRALARWDVRGPGRGALAPDWRTAVGSPAAPTARGVAGRGPAGGSCTDRVPDTGPASTRTVGAAGALTTPPGASWPVLAPWSACTNAAPV